jgi:predicted thioesterase
MTLQEQYNLIKEGKGHKGVFLTEAKKQFPDMLTNPMGFEEASKMLKTRGVISENYVDLKPINTIEASPKSAWENKFAQFLAEEAKAVEKKTTKEVEDIQAHNYDYKDKTNLDNQIGQEVLNGLYFEGRENPDKTLDELRKIVAKNLAKDGQYYMKNAAFGVKGLGYQQTEVEEVAGKYASSGYSDKLKKMVKESLSESKSSDLAKMGYSASDIEDFMDEWKNGGSKLPKKVKDYLDGKKSSIKEEEFPTTPVEKLPFVSADKLRKVLQVVDKINVQVGPMSSTEVKNEADLVRVLMAELRFKQVRPGVYILQGPNDSTVTMGKGSLDEASDFEEKMAQLRMLQMQKKSGVAPDQKVINKKQTLTQKLNMLKKAYFDLISAMEKESDLEFAVSGDWYQEQLDDLENSIGDLETKIQSINENAIGEEVEITAEVENVEEAEPKAEKKAVKKESLDAELAEIDTQAGIVAMEAKLDKISEMISTKMERLNMIEEDANLAELVDKGKMKAMQKEIKVLEKAKAKMEKMYEKMNGKAYTKEMVDESSFDNE